MLKVGLWGFGGIAQSHKNGYKILEKKGLDIKLVAACDIDPVRFEKKTKTNLDTDLQEDEFVINNYPSIESMLENEELDIIDICLPTYLHAQAAQEVLSKGYHVMSEKPMALNTLQCTQMLKIAENAKGMFMIGQCLRFYPQYQYLKSVIDENKYGKVLSAYFDRLSMPPIWGYQNWFLDHEKSGGCLLDMHIHDVDMIRFLFGEPEGVSCVAQNTLSKFDAIHTNFKYSDKLVVATGDWSLKKEFGFRHAYRVNFENATIVFENDEVTVYEEEGKHQPEMIKNDGITNEIEYFCSLISESKKNIENEPKDSAKTVKLIEIMRKSAEDSGSYIAINE